MRPFLKDVPTESYRFFVQLIKATSSEEYTCDMESTLWPRRHVMPR